MRKTNENREFLHHKDTSVSVENCTVSKNGWKHLTRKLMGWKTSTGVFLNSKHTCLHPTDFISEEYFCDDRPENQWPLWLDVISAPSSPQALYGRGVNSSSNFLWDGQIYSSAFISIVWSNRLLKMNFKFLKKKVNYAHYIHKIK